MTPARKAAQAAVNAITNDDMEMYPPRWVEGELARRFAAFAESQLAAEVADWRAKHGPCACGDGSCPACVHDEPLEAAGHEAFAAEHKLEGVTLDRDRLLAEHAEQAAEVERLRAAMDKILRCSDDDCAVDVAREALAAHGRPVAQPAPVPSASAYDLALALTRRRACGAVVSAQDDGASEAGGRSVRDQLSDLNARCGPITHDEAHQILVRFCNSHFNNARDKHEHARMSIPVDPRRDDDVRLGAYIEQQRAIDADTARAELARVREELEAANRELRAWRGPNPYGVAASERRLVASCPLCGLRNAWHLPPDGKPRCRTIDAKHLISETDSEIMAAPFGLDALPPRACPYVDGEHCAACPSAPQPSAASEPTT